MQLSVCVSTFIHTLPDFKETTKNCWTHAAKETIILQGMDMVFCWQGYNQEMIRFYYARSLKLVNPNAVRL